MVFTVFILQFFKYSRIRCVLLRAIHFFTTKSLFFFLRNKHTLNEYSNVPIINVSKAQSNETPMKPYFWEPLCTLYFSVTPAETHIRNCFRKRAETIACLTSLKFCLHYREGQRSALPLDRAWILPTVSRKNRAFTTPLKTYTSKTSHPRVSLINSAELKYLQWCDTALMKLLYRA